MYVAEVEIYSDTTNAAIMRHPGRKFPGYLIQGDTLYTMVANMRRLAAELPPSGVAADEARRLQSSLEAMLTHYKNVLGDHDIKPPFDDQ